MTNWPGQQRNPPREPGWVDPDAATRAAPRYERPPSTHAGPQPWAAPPPASVSTGHQHWPPPAHPQRSAPSAPPNASGQPPQLHSVRRRHHLRLAAAAVVLLVSGTVAYMRVTGVDGGITAGGGTESSTAQSAPTTTTQDGSSVVGQTVLGYLEALRNGDAEKALSYGEKRPEDTTLLTDDILGKQLAQWPISDIRIHPVEGNEAIAEKMFVTVSLKFGDKKVTDQISVTRNPQGGWWIDYVANEYKPGSDSATHKTLSVFGKQLIPERSVFAFPGYLEITTSNKYIDVVAKEHTTFSSWPVLAPPTIDIAGAPELNSAGETAVRAAVEQAFARCEGSTLTHPPGCPARLPAGEDGAVTWGRADIGELKNHLVFDLMVRVSGITYIPITYQNADGHTVTDRMPWVNTEDVDISSDPPRVVT